MRRGIPRGYLLKSWNTSRRRKGWELQYVPGSWLEGLGRLERGEIDLMPDVAYTSERGKVFAFHQEPVLSDWFQIYARKGSGIKSIVDLPGKRVAILEGSIQQSALASLADSFGMDIVPVLLPDYHTIFSQVAAGKAGAAVTNRFYGVMHAEQFGARGHGYHLQPDQGIFCGRPWDKGKTCLPR